MTDAQQNFYTDSSPLFRFVFSSKGPTLCMLYIFGRLIDNSLPHIFIYHCCCTVCKWEDSLNQTLWTHFNIRCNSQLNFKIYIDVYYFLKSFLLVQPTRSAPLRSRNLCILSLHYNKSRALVFGSMMFNWSVSLSHFSEKQGRWIDLK
jgi:hypothetical protein